MIFMANNYLIQLDENVIENTMDKLSIEKRQGSALVLHFENPNNPDTFILATARKRGHVKLFLMEPDEDDAIIDPYCVSAYTILSDGDWDYVIQFIEDIQGTDDYQDGGSVTDKKAMANLIVDAVTRYVELNEKPIQKDPNDIYLDYHIVLKYRNSEEIYDDVEMLMADLADKYSLATVQRILENQYPDIRVQYHVSENKYL